MLKSINDTTISQFLSWRSAIKISITSGRQGVVLTNPADSIPGDSGQGGISRRRYCIRDEYRGVRGIYEENSCQRQVASRTDERDTAALRHDLARPWCWLTAGW